MSDPLARPGGSTPAVGDPGRVPAASHERIGGGAFPGCHLCGGSLAGVPGYSRLRRVTSDCKPWETGGHVAVCGGCGAVQKPIDARWRGETEQIYRDYTIYHQSEGVEQAVFEGSGAATRRSERILCRLREEVGLPDRGRMLDVGCGSGVMLRAFGSIAPEWILSGSDLDDRCREAVLGIPAVHAFYGDGLERIPGRFDFISLVHVLEHVPHPDELLSRLRGMLERGGRVLFQVPDYLRNPFDLLVADHATHFSAVTLAELLRRAGFRIVACAADWVPKELTLVAEPDEAGARAGGLPDENACRSVAAAVGWLWEIVQSAVQLPVSTRLGVFGTSIAATWLAAELQDRVSFFVDEDPHRVGRDFLGRPVLAPAEVPGGSHLFLVLPPEQARTIRARVSHLPVVFHLPPQFPA